MKKKKKILVVSFQSLTANSAGGMARLGYYLSGELHKRGLLKEFIVHSKGKFETNFPSKPVSSFSRYYLFVLNKLNKYLKMPAYRFRLIQEHLFDILCKSHINTEVDILFTTNAHMRRTFVKAKKLRIPIVYIPANPEENYIDQIVTEEKNKLGLHTLDAYTYKPRLDFYNESIKYVDKIIGTYPTVYDSYKRSNTTSEIVKIIGHLKPDFKPVQVNRSVESGTFKIGYLAHTVVLKGLHYLLEAWEQIINEYPDIDAHLYVAGGMDKELKEYIHKRFSGLKKLQMIGHVADVTEYLKDKHLFVVPSLVDGGPYTALEAAHYGVPVLITDNCGSAELLGRNESGCWIVPIRDAAGLKERILHAYNNRAETVKTGMNAKHNLENYKMEELISDVADHLQQM